MSEQSELKGGKGGSRLWYRGLSPWSVVAWIWHTVAGVHMEEAAPLGVDGDREGVKSSVPSQAMLPSDPTSSLPPGPSSNATGGDQPSSWTSGVCGPNCSTRFQGRGARCYSLMGSDELTSEGDTEAASTGTSHC